MGRYLGEETIAAKAPSGSSSPAKTSELYGNVANTNNITANVSNNDPIKSPKKEVECPVCSKSFKNLRKLNKHLDQDHGFLDHEEEPETLANQKPVVNNKKVQPHILKNIQPIDQQVSRDSPVTASDTSDSSRYAKQRFKLSTSHYQQKKSQNICSTCHNNISSQDSINCRKCGKIQCHKHCRNAIKLNSLAKYDPTNGEWCRCCPTCFDEKPGRNAVGTEISNFKSFEQLRKKHLEDSELILLQLDMRLVKLINGINYILEQHKYSFISGFQVSSDISKLEKSLVEWDDSPSVCSACNKSITSITSKKHHCRLCGQYICNSNECSKELPLLLLCAVIESVNEDNFAKLPMDLRYTHNAVLHPDIMLRFCRTCTRLSFTGKKFKMDLKQPLPPLFQNFERLFNMMIVLNSLTPQFSQMIDVATSSKTMTAAECKKFIIFKKKIFGTFEMFEFTNKQILTLKCENDSQKIIQKNISLAATSFIQTQLVPLRSKLSVVLEKNLINEQMSTRNSKKDILKTDRTAQDIKNINADREQLMVFQEQKFIVENMIAAAKNERKFDEIEALQTNVEVIEKSIKELQEALGNMSRAELYELNINAWSFPPTFPNLASKLDTSIKKNTGFIKKLRLGITKDTLPGYLEDLKNVSLSKYLSEVCSTLATETLLKISNKQEDLHAAVQVISALHQRFGTEFTEPFFALWLNSFDCESRTKDCVTDNDIVSSLKSIASQIYILCELQIVQCVPKIDDLLSFKNSLPKFLIGKLTKKEPLVISVLKELVNYNFKSGVSTYIISTKFVKSFPELFNDAESSVSFYGFDEDLLQTIRAMFKLLAQTSLDQVNTFHAKLPKLLKEVEKSQIRTGKAINEYTERYDLAKTVLNYFYQAAEILCPLYAMDVPAPLDEAKMGEELNEEGGTSELITNKVKPLHKRIWETDDIQKFYETLPLLNLPKDGEKRFYQEDEHIRREVRNAFFQQLADVEDVRSVDHLAAEYDVIGIDGTSTRKRLLNFVIELQDWNKINLYARFLATCAPIFLDVIEKLVEYLDNGFRSQLHSNKINVKNILFYCELVKFRLVPSFMMFHKLRTLIINLNIPNNIEIINILFEQIGRLLLNHPDYQENMSKMVELLKEKSKNFNLSMPAKLQIESTLLLLFPPSLKNINGFDNANNRLENHEVNFLYYLIRKEIHSLSTRVISELIKRANWKDPEVFSALLDIFTQPECIDYNSIERLTKILSTLQGRYKFFVNQVIDTVLENIQCGLENNNFAKNMTRLSQTKYLVELFNHDSIKFDDLLDTAYKFIKFGHKSLFLDDKSNLDLPNNHFRVNLICTLLLTLKFESKHAKKSIQQKLALYLRYFEYYTFTKERPFSMELEAKIAETFKYVSVHLEEEYQRGENLKDCADKLIESLKQMDQHRATEEEEDEEEDDDEEEGEEEDQSDLDDELDVRGESTRDISGDDLTSDSSFSGSDESDDSDDESTSSSESDEFDSDMESELDSVSEEEALAIARELELQKLSEEYNQKMQTEEEVAATDDFEKQFQAMMQESMDSRRNEKFMSNSAIPVNLSKGSNVTNYASQTESGFPKEQGQEQEQATCDLPMQSSTLFNSATPGKVAFKFLSKNGKKINTKTLELSENVSFVSNVIEENNKRKDERERIKKYVLKNLDI
ncbi:hypothetical protein ACO0QE_000649 [Hanseniaspora vineae]